ncbi:c-type cytochrome [Brumimicrobium glaciale]|uniref:C-type cytochrome n=1 Tax=Brumimicrobium glaciale TaxID=200475 RepID=A0A4Q4KQD4_9FLAO|nr:cytochrome c3 family protein [Brumimicrobium glaciale]RYM34229.1 c-type cytochrome [Brumimicrobium glaciale]
MFNKGNKGLFALVLTLFMLTNFVSNAQEGESIFNSKCATCHAPHKDMTGPKLFEVRQKWEEGGAMEGSLHQWVKNWQVAAATDPYAKEVSDWAPSAMTLFADLTDEQIEAVFDYVDEQPKGGAVADAAGAAGGGVASNIATEENDFGWIWYILGAVFLVIIFSVGGVKRQLQELDEDADKQVKVGSKVWVFKNRKYVGIGVLVLVMAGVVWLFLGLYQIGVVSSYQPSQPIAFPHDIHAGINGIDCKYCHNSADKSKSAGIPTTNVCMNCHKQIQGAGDQVEKIKNIYASAGFSPEGGGKYSGETEPIIWNKVHNLPDHVYFNHSQHVEIGGIDCKQCHGDMTKQNELPRVVPVEELNMVEGNIQLTRPTLTMGWCIECHNVKEVSTGTLEGKGGYYDEIHKRLLENDESLYEEYLEDGKVTVNELGGWECAKCHY